MQFAVPPGSNQGHRPHGDSRRSPRYDEPEDPNRMRGRLPSPPITHSSVMASPEMSSAMYYAKLSDTSVSPREHKHEPTLMYASLARNSSHASPRQSSPHNAPPSSVRYEPSPLRGDSEVNLPPPALIGRQSQQRERERERERTPSPTSMRYASTHTHAVDSRIEDLVRAVIILRDEVAHLRDDNTTEFTIHANAIASIREEMGDLHRTQAPKEDSEGLRRMSKLHHDMVSEVYESVNGLRVYVDERNQRQDESAERLGQRVRELQESLETRLEDIDTVAERVDVLENRDDSPGYVTHNGERLSTMTQLVDECKTRVMDDALGGFRMELDTLNGRMRTLENNDSLEQCEALNNEVEALKEKIADLNGLDMDGIQESVNKVSEQVEGFHALQEDVEAIKEKICDLDGIGLLHDNVNRISEQMEALDGIQEEVEGLKEKVDEMDAVREEVNKLNECIEQFDELQEDIDGLKEKVAKWNKFDSLQEDVNKLSEEFGVLQEDLDGLRDTLENSRALASDAQDVDLLRDKIAQLEGSVDDLMKEDKLAGVASRMDDVEDMHVRLLHHVKDGQDAQLGPAVENARVAITELSQNISSLTRRVESQCKNTTKLKNHVTESVDAVRTLQSQVSWLLSRGEVAAQAQELPKPSANPYLAMVPKSITNRVDAAPRSARFPTARLPQTAAVGSTVRAMKCPCSPSRSPSYTPPRRCVSSSPPRQSPRCTCRDQYTFSGCRACAAPQACPKPCVVRCEERCGRDCRRECASSRKTSPYCERLVGRMDGLVCVRS